MLETHWIGRGGVNKYLREPRCLQELLRGARAKVKQVGRPQPEDPGVHFVSYLTGQTNNFIVHFI